jgi:peptidoglycan hydrolase-like protein with peptidoglycan-binding domain
MSEIKKILEIANNEVGYLEKASNNNLDDKTANAGDKNYTKYARDMDALNVYNGKKQGYAWCNVFIDWCFVQAVGIDRARELLIGWSAGCTQDYNWFKTKGQIVSEPQIGDLVFFNNLSHIGIIEDVKDGKIYTIEGNTSNAAELIINGGSVAKKSYDLNSKYIYGYARPKYDESSAETAENTVENEITYSLIKKGSKGNLVRIAQEKLLAKGYKLPKYGADGDYGSETEEAIKELQKDAKISVDGICGDDTWAVINSDFVKPTESYPGYLIKKGQISEDVRKVQARLIELGYSCGNCGADSIFGNSTYNAVVSFQKANGLSTDGIIGPLTWEKLF